jgi:fibrillarin-like pre-rRNA processing protein
MRSPHLNDLERKDLAGEKSVAARIRAHPKFPGIYWAILEDGTQKLATKNYAPGKNVYGEQLVRYRGVEYRLWDPFRSKLAAAVLNDLKVVPIQSTHKVLYLGAASGTTASHVSDIVQENGHVFCVEFASRAIRELVNNVCEYRANMSPILADARLPEQYSMLVGEVDDIYCDIAQPEQAKVLADNADLLLAGDRWIMLAIKAQSIDVTKDPSEVYKQEINTLKARGFQVDDVIHLEPYDKAHAMIVAQHRSK